MPELCLCLFLNEPGSLKTVVTVGDPQHPELPCNELSAPKSYINFDAKPVNPQGCLCQRQNNLCPRGFSQEVDKALCLSNLKSKKK
jgi:hypothetical protein